jgi:N-acetylmuramoyl-L-alanine amidase
MRQINKIIVHCTATPEGREVTKEDLHKWHVVDRNFSDIGYHWFIDLNGERHECRPEHKSGAHAKGHNSDSIGICYAGGCDTSMNPKDTRTEAQKEGLHCMIQDLLDRYRNAEVIGHRDISSKACPSFDAKEEYKDMRPYTL